MKAAAVHYRLRRDMDDLADFVSQDYGLLASGRALGMSKDRTMTVWRHIRNKLGWQAI